jgi:hypothetical protein
MAPEAMDPEVARNQNDDDHDANEGKDIHSALLPLHDDGAQCARAPAVSAAIKSAASFRHSWPGSIEAQ